MESLLVSMRTRDISKVGTETKLQEAAHRHSSDLGTPRDSGGACGLAGGSSRHLCICSVSALTPERALAPAKRLFVETEDVEGRPKKTSMP